MAIEISLNHYLSQKGNTQEHLAKKLGVTQGAIQQMSASKRDIRLIIEGERITAYEVRPVPAKRKSSAA